MIHESTWLATRRPTYPPCKPPAHLDVVVIGAGITGLTAAWELKRAGKRVGVFDKGRIASGETSRTSAHLTCVTDRPLGTLVTTFGDERARLAWEAGREAIAYIARTVAEHELTCGFARVPCLLYPSVRSHDPRDVDDLREEVELARQLGFPATFVDAGPIHGLPAASFPDQAIIQPVTYAHALAALVDGDSCVVCEDSEVVRVIDDPLAVIVNGEIVGCDYLIVATHVPLAGAATTLSASLFQSKLYPYSTYVLGARLPDGLLPPGLYNDTSDPYYYLRVHRDAKGSYAVFGGEDHKTGQVRDTEQCYAQLQRVLGILVPEARVERRWSGQVIETHDGLPFIGETAERQFVATGYAGNGLTFGTFAGLMARDAVFGRENAWGTVFSPGRKHLALGTGTLVRENLDFPLHFVGDRLRRSEDAGALEALAPGEGAVVTIDKRRLACHRTENGEVIALDARCTHMGCLVRWNGADRSWDCPCHGSRFAVDGTVLGGPAEEPLERIALAHTADADGSPHLTLEPEHP
jgi:glycine/D-amino acid oxidase-like deaminating enzyme/nitrite reductase/ring-hydroxylating ferredoxin subunit